MAYDKNTWIDQEVERPKTYEITNNADGSVTLTDSFGLVSELGTPVNADNMNHIEEGIAACDARKYSPTETFDKYEWATGIVNNKKSIYQSLKDGNLGNPLTDEIYWKKATFDNDEINNPFFYGLSIYSDIPPENSSWLASLGQENFKNQYPDYYNWIDENTRNGVKNFKGTTGYGYSQVGFDATFWTSVTDLKIGTIVYGYGSGTDGQFPCGTVQELTADGFIFTDANTGSTKTVTRNSTKDISGANWISDYDFEINTENETFKLPLKNGKETILDFSNITTSMTFPYMFHKNGVIYLSLGSENSTVNKIYIYINGKLVDDIAGSSTARTSIAINVKKGDVISTTGYNSNGPSLHKTFIPFIGNGTLYYYVGDTIKNAQIIDAGAIMETLTNKADINLLNITSQGKQSIKDNIYPIFANSTRLPTTINLVQKLSQDGYIFCYTAEATGQKYFSVATCNSQGEIIEWLFRVSGQWRTSGWTPLLKKDTYIKVTEAGYGSIFFVPVN